ncbi:MAG: glycyl-radical enzyme activating protein [Lachnospiraceae bacterium]|nr:glycyl-radical enzyme activating protein [Lachnospiraceae bacterium]
METLMSIGIVFNIQHFSVHDGHGIRTVVFLKGCPLRCKWCANPESQKAYPEMGWTKKECIGCGGCIKELKVLACCFEQERLIWNADVLKLPDFADDICPSGALHVIGKCMSADEVLAEVEKDQKFYENSEGGLTLSGGEPMMQDAFAGELLAKAKSRHMRTSMETCGFAPTDTAVRLCRHLDELIMDIKLLDPDRHKKWTGADNGMILRNIHAIREAYPDLPILVRTPVIPGVNDNEDELINIARLAKKLNAGYEILKYHRLGVSKYESLNREYPMGSIELSAERFEQLKRIVEQVRKTY